MVATIEKPNHMFKDETGNRYDRWTVLRRAPNKKNQGACWLCRCDCSREKTMLGKYLRAGHASNCGCFPKNIIDLAGKVYGRLTVLRYMGTPVVGHPAWLCQCICGKKKTIRGQSLRSGSTRSCGCIHTEGNYQRKPYGVAAFNELYQSIKYKAKVRGYEFELTRKQVRKLTSQDCTYCGKPPSQKMKNGLGPYIYNGIDRVNNDEGYIENNVVSCCGICNYAKRAMGVDEFAAWVTQVHKYFIEGNTQ